MNTVADPGVRHLPGTLYFARGDEPLNERIASEIERQFKNKGANVQKYFATITARLIIQSFHDLLLHAFDTNGLKSEPNLEQLACSKQIELHHKVVATISESYAHGRRYNGPVLVQEILNAYKTFGYTISEPEA
jgi:hypothetical protein